MSTTYHSAIATGAAANAATFNTPLGTLDAAIVALDTEIGNYASMTGTPASMTDALKEFAAGDIDTISPQLLKTWTESGAYEMTSLTYDATYATVVASGVVKWPDAKTGVFTTITINATWWAIDAYRVTWVRGGVTKTVTQAAVTRNANGSITAKPALSVS